MDRRRVFRNAFLWNALVSALMAGAALYARSGARGWLAAGVLVWRLRPRRWPAFAKHGPPRQTAQR